MRQLRTRQKIRPSQTPKSLAEVTPQYLTRQGVEVVSSAMKATDRAFKKASPTDRTLATIGVGLGVGLLAWKFGSYIATAQRQEMNAKYGGLRLIP